MPFSFGSLTVEAGTFARNASAAIPSIPGDPAALLQAAKDLEAVANEIRDGAYRLGVVRANLASTWKGRGQPGFDFRVSKFQAGRTVAADAVYQASAALSTFGQLLGQCQEEVKTAQAALEEAQARATSALARVYAQPLPPHDPAAAAARAHTVGVIEDELASCVRVSMGKGQAAWDRYQAAAARCAAGVDATLALSPCC